MEEGNLTLTLGFSGELGDSVAYAKMTTPVGAVEEKEPDQVVQEEVQGIKSFSLGSSEEEEIDGMLLGESAQAKTLSGEFVFEASEYGTYEFELYDENEQLIGVVSYGVRALGDLTVTFSEPKNPLNYRNQGWSFIMNYQKKVLGEKEVVSFYLPPFATISSYPPNSANNYNISVTNIPVPAEFYPETEAAKLLSGYTIQRVDVTFLESNDADTSLSFSYNITTNNNNFYNLGQLMIQSGDDYQDIPFKFIATTGKADGSMRYSTQVLDQGISIIPDASGNPTPGNQSNPVTGMTDWSSGGIKNAAVNYNTTYPHFSVPNNSTALSVGAWHYPITNLKLYTPVYPWQTPADPSLLYTDPVTGDQYNIAAQSNLMTVNTAQSLSGSTGYLNELDLTEMKATTTATPGYYKDLLVSYTYMGVDYGPVPYTKNLNTLQIPAVSFLEGLTTNRSLNPGNHNGETADKRVQGRTGDTLQYTYFNVSGNQITPYYEDMTFSYEFPYEVMPKTTGFTITKSHNFGGPNAPTPAQTTPTGTYTVYGDTTPRNINFTAVSGGYKATYAGISTGEHIQKVDIFYEDYPPLTTQYIYLPIDYGTEDEAGNILPMSYPVNVVETVVGTKIKQKNTDDPIVDNYTRSSTLALNLIRYEAEDGLMFGRTGEHGGENTLSDYNLYGGGTGLYTIFGQATIRKATVISKTYPKMTIYFEGDNTGTAADGRLISLTNGLGIQNFNVLEPAVDEVKVYRKTNLNSNWTEIPRDPTQDSGPGNYGWVRVWTAPLQDGEYPTEYKMDLINLDSNKLNYAIMGGGDNQNNKYINPGGSNTTNIRIILMSDSSKRAFFQGSPEEEAVTVTTQATYRVRAEVEGGAQHINASSTVVADSFLINSYKQTLNVKPYGTYNYQEGSNWRTLGLQIQKDGVYGNYDAYQGSGFQYYGNYSYSNYGTLFDRKFQNGLKIRFYFNTSEYVDISKLGVYNAQWGSVDSRTYPSTLVEEKELADGSKLYVFEITATEPRCEFYLQGRIRPDTPAPSTVPLIYSSGWAFVDLKDDYLGDIDGKPYYESSPYIIYNFPGQVSFPASWGIDESNLIPYYKVSSAVSKGVGLNVISKGEITLFNNNLMSGTHDFYTKDNLGADLAIVAGTGGMQQYETVLGLGRKGETLQTIKAGESTVSDVTSDYDVYLQRPLNASDLSGLVNPVVKYYTDEALTNEVMLTASSTEEELKSVKFIYVYCENISDLLATSFYMPLYTDYNKREVVPIYSYISAKGRDFNAAAYTVYEAKPFTYNSFAITSRLKMDSTETGTLSTTNIPSDLLTYKVYYDNGMGGDAVTFETSTITNGSLVAQVNEGITRIELTINDKYKDQYMFTVPEKAGVGEMNDSDFPRPASGSYTSTIYIGDGAGEVPMSSITTYVPNLFDAGFIIIPKLELEDIEVKVGESVEETLQVLQTTNNAVPAQIQYYQKNVSYLPTGQNFATIVESVNIAAPNIHQKKLNITGVKKGVINYTVTVVNRLGDQFIFNKTVDDTAPQIKVIPDWVQFTSISKQFKNANESIITPLNDKFSVEISVLDDAGTPETTGIVSGITSGVGEIKVANGAGTTSLIIEKGMTHRIREVNIPTGYKFEDLDIIIDNVAVAKTAVLDGSGVATGEYSFVVPIDAQQIEIKLYNQWDYGTAGAVQISKNLVGGVLNNKDSFTVTLQGPGFSAGTALTLNEDGTAVNLPSLVAGQKYTLTETNEGSVSYTLSDMVEADTSNPLGLAQTSTGSKVYEFTAPASNTAVGTHQIEVKNIHDTSASIEITKAMATGQVAFDAVNDKMKFVVSGGNLAAGSEKEIELTVGGIGTIRGLTPGVTYTLTETAPEGYQLQGIAVQTGSATGATATKVSETVYSIYIPESKDAEVMLKVTNEYDMIPDGTVQVHKVLNGGEVGNPLDNEFEVKFTPVNGNIPAAFVVTTAPKVNTATAPADNAVIVDADNLIVGQTYRVIETSKTGYELVSITGTGVVKNPSGQYEFTVPNDLSASNQLEITVTNKLSKGKVFFEKDISNPSSELLTSEGSTFTIEVWPTDGSYATDKEVYTLTYDAGGTEITGLFAGKDYYVRELNKTHYSFTGMSGGTGTTAIAVVSPQPGTPTTANSSPIYVFTAPDASIPSTTYTVENKVDYLDDSLFVKKDLAGVDLQLQGTPDQFRLLVKGPNKPVAGEEILITDGQIINLKNLLKNTQYTIEEDVSSLNIGYLFDGMTASGITVTRQEDTTVGQERVWYEFTTPTTSPAANTVGITVNNKNNELSNVLTVKKLVDLKTGQSLIPGSTTVDLTLWRKGDSKPVTPNITGLTMNGAASTPTISLIAGQTYYIEETMPAGYVFKSIKLTTTENTTEVSLSKDGTGFYFVAPQTASNITNITITNEVTATTVKLSKTITNPDAALIGKEGKEFTFYVWPASEGTARPSTAKEYKVEAGNVLDITDLHSATDYYIDEQAKNYYALDAVKKGGASLAAEAGTTGVYKFTTISDGTVQLEFVNKTQYATDTVSVQKNFSGVILNAETSFKVVVNGPNKTNEVHTLVVNTTTGNSQIEGLTGLLEGGTYTVHEDITGLNAGYVFDTITGGTLSSDGTTASFTASSSGTNLSILVKNKNKVISPNVVFLKKTIANNEAPIHATDQFSFAIYREGTNISTAANIQVSANGTVSLSNLIAGQRYYIVEDATTGYLLNQMSINGTALSKDGNGLYYFDAALDDTAGFTIEVENRISYGEVTLNKSISNVSNHLLSTVGNDFEFLIWRADEGKATAKTYTVNYPNALSITDLQGGQTYYLEEVAKYPYLLEGVSGANGTSTAGVYEFTAPLETEASLGINVTNKVDYLDADVIGIRKNLQGVVLENGTDFEVVIDGLNLDEEVFVLNADGTTVFPGVFLANTTYTIRENEHSNAGYLKAGMLGDQISLTETSSGVYSFTTPASSTTVQSTISVVNKNKILDPNTVKIAKVIEKGHELLNANDTFSFTIWRAGTTMPNDPNMTLTPNGVKYNLSNLIAGQKYYISEGGVEFYREGGTTVNGAPIQNDGIGNYFIAPNDDSRQMDILVKNEVDYLPDGTIRVKPEMGYGDSELMEYRDKAGDNEEVFDFYVWRAGGTKPVRPNYQARLNDNWGTPLTNIIANMKYYVEQAPKEGYLVDGVFMNDMQGSSINTYVQNAYFYDMPLQRDGQGYYFIAPANADMNYMVTSVNVNDDIPLGTFELEAVMAQGESNNPPDQRVRIVTTYADNTSYDGKEEYLLAIDKETVEMRGIVAARRYYILPEEVSGYHVEEILYNGNEIDQDEGGYYFTASSRGNHTMISVVYALGEEEVLDSEIVLGVATGSSFLPNEFLPNTGGISISFLALIAGGVLVLAGIVVMVVKKKKEDSQQDSKK